MSGATPAPQRPSVRRAMVFSLAQKGAASVVQLAVAVVLARLLTPQETGIFSLSVAAVSIGQLLREFGVSDYLISRRDLNQQQIRAAFTATLLLAWVAAAALWLLAGPMAQLYHEPGVRTTMQLLCVSFALLPFGAVSFALMSKTLEFGRIASLQTAAMLVGAATTLLCAWAGQSYLSMAWGAIASNLATIVLLLLVQPGAVVLRPAFRGLREVMGFGGRVMGARLLEQVAGRSAEFIITGWLGFHATGIYGKTMSLNNSFNEFFNSGVARVATPAFAQAGSGALEQLKDAYLRATIVVASILWLFFPVLAVFADEVVLVLFGPQWAECVPLVRIAAIGSLFHAPFLLSGSLLSALGAAREQLRVQFISAPVAVLALLVGVQWGLVPAFTAAALAGFVRLALINAAVRRLSGLGGLAVTARLGPTFLVGLGAVLAGLAVKFGGTALGWPPVVVVVVGPLLAALAGLGAAALVRHPLIGELAPVWRKLAGRT